LQRGDGYNPVCNIYDELTSEYDSNDENYSYTTDFWFQFELPADGNVVYYGFHEFDDLLIKKLRTFDNFNKAILYMRKQYELLHGRGPFVQNGITSAYKHTGIFPQVHANYPLEIINKYTDCGFPILILASDDNIEI
jgi:hypothetical protein